MITEEKIIDAIKEVYDPEIPVNIYDLGLIYNVDIQKDNAVKIQMTLTTPACPVAGTLPKTVEDKVMEKNPEITTCEVELVWDPPWTQDRMTDAAKLELGLF